MIFFKRLFFSLDLFSVRYLLDLCHAQGVSQTYGYCALKTSVTLSCCGDTHLKCDTPYILSGTVVLFPQHYRKLLLNRYSLFFEWYAKKKPICDLFLLRRRAFCPATGYSKRHARLFPHYLYLQGSKNLIIVIIICRLDLWKNSLRHVFYRYCVIQCICILEQKANNNITTWWILFELEVKE